MAIKRITGIIKPTESGLVLKGFEKTYKLKECVDSVPINTYLVFDSEIDEKNETAAVAGFSIPGKNDLEEIIRSVKIRAGSLKSIVEYDKAGAMAEQINRFSEILAADLALCKAMIVRFNNDADGISGGIALAEIPGTHIQHNSPIYEVEDATHDLMSLRDEMRKTVILVDFGSNEESLDGIMMLEANNVNVRIIDHHPLSKEITQHATVLNSWETTGSSQITAGYVAAEVARRLNLIDEETSVKLAKISFAGDKSPLLGQTELDAEMQKTASAIDYLASYSERKLAIEDYAKLLYDKQAMELAYFMAVEKNEAIKELLEKHSKKHSAGELSIIEVLLEKMPDFKSKSKICNVALEMAGQEKPSIIIGRSKERTIFRVNAAAIKLGLRADEIIEELKQKELVETGGGHSVAATTNYRKGMEKLVFSEIMQFIKNRVQTE